MTTKKKPTKKTTGKKATAKKPARKPAARKSSKKTTGKKPAKRPTGRKPATKQSARKRPAARKPAKRPAKVYDLNTVRPVGTTKQKALWEPRTRSTQSGNVSAFCGDLATEAVEFIRSAEHIVCCVAWITSSDILSALAEYPETATLCIQKERTLVDTGPWPVALRKRYAALSSGALRRTMPYPVNVLNGPPRMATVRSVGYCGRRRDLPLMHNKFMVAGRIENNTWIAERVWTGSFNFSKAAERSFENAVIVDDPEIATHYLNEFARIFALSEPMSWTSRVSKPEYRTVTS